METFKHAPSTAQAVPFMQEKKQMAKECFQQIRLSASSLAMVDVMNGILDSYAAQGYDLSARQLYYQLVSRNVVENTEKSYKRVTGILSDARLAGLVDWDMIKDRGRETTQTGHWENPGQIAMDAARAFRLDRWKDQPEHVEVMVEKQALEGVLEPVCRELDIPFTANKGYSSSSCMYEIGKRLQERCGEGDCEKTLHVLYLGDHDPSGIDMTRDVEERLSLFSECHVQVHRLALNMDQVRRYNPPENPAKLSDSRANSYIKSYGRSSWELDALEPTVLAKLVRDNVATYRDDDLYNAIVAREETMRTELLAVARKYKT